MTTTIATLRTLLQAADPAGPDRPRLLLQLGSRLIVDDPEQARACIEEGIDLLGNDDRGAERMPDAYHQLAIAEEACGDLVGSIHALGRVLRLISEGAEADAAATRARMAEIERERARLQRARGNYAEALGHLGEAIAIAEEIADLPGQAIGLKGRADLYADIGDDDRALAGYFAALRVAESSGSEEIIGVCLGDIALLQSDNGEHDRAIEHLRRAREIFARHERQAFEVRTLANLASVSSAAGDHASGLDYALRALAIYEVTDDLPALATTLANLAAIYEALDDPEKGIECNARAFDLFDRIGDERGCATAMLHTGRIYRKMERLQDALFVVEQALGISHSCEDDQLCLGCYDLLSDLQEELGDPVAALAALRTAVTIRDRVDEQERRRGLADLQTQYDLERAEREREVYRRENRALEAENRNKVAELTSLSMLLVERSRLIKEVRLAIEKIAGRLPDEEKQEVAAILRSIRSGSNRERDWQEFERQFRTVHHDFLDRLARAYPTLTATERRVCALIKTGLSSAEIATMLHVTKRNIDTHRYRLRKKLGISTEISLPSFLAKL